MGFNIGISGLNAAQNMLAVSGNNIANANTTGFKESRAEFGDVYSASVAGVQQTTPGSGAKVLNDAQQFSQGSIKYTENSLDMAITGEGFFVLGETTSDPSVLSYTRDGSFHLDTQGYVVNNTNNPLLVYPPNDPNNLAAGFSVGIQQPIQIDTSQANPQATTSVAIDVNLNTSDPKALSQDFNTQDDKSYNYSTSVNVFDSLGVSHTVTTYYRKSTDTPGSVATGGSVWDVYVDIDNSSSVPGAGGVGANLTGPFKAEFDASGNLVGPPYTDPVTGISYNDGSVTSFATSLDPNNPGAEVHLLDGSIMPGTTVTFQPTGGAEQVSFTLDLSGSTSFSSPSSVNTVHKDGFATGNLESLSTDANGVMYAHYSNGSSVILGQAAMANFQNPQGLTKLGDTRWAESTVSGQAQFGQAGTGNFGRMQSGALESSNVDLASELVQLIIAQQAYQANTQTIQTENTIVQSLLNIR